MLTIDTSPYHEQGFLVLPGVFTAKEVTAWQDECDRLLTLDLIDADNGRTPFRMGATKMPERIDPVVDISPCFAELAQDPRINHTVAQILNDQPVLFKDKLIYKAPGVDGYRMHQDWAWGWQDLCPANHILSVSIQVDGADSSNGGIELFSGYHDRLLTPAGEATNFRSREEAMIDPARGTTVTTKPGDVLIFHSLTPHRSGRNASDRPRRSLYLTLNAQSVGDLRTAYYKNYTHPDWQGGKYFR